MEVSLRYHYVVVLNKKRVMYLSNVERKTDAGREREREGMKKMQFDWDKRGKEAYL